MRVLYRLLFGIVALGACVIAVFFLWGLSDGTVAADTILLWLAMLAVPIGALVAARRIEHRGLATLSLALVAVPLALVGTVFLMLVLLAPDWK